MINETKKFLKALDPEGDKFTFQTFDESPEKRTELARILHGTIDQHYAALEKLNKAGAGIYVTVNETDLKGREAGNVRRVRAVFVDLDGSPLAPAKTSRKPHIVVESSPKRWHVYWRVKDLPLDEFKPAQKKLIKLFNADRNCCDLPRVLRLPGFMHRKGKPFKTKLVEAWDGEPYKAVEFISHEVEKKKTKKTIKNTAPADLREIHNALEVLPADDYQVWFEVGAALHKELGDEKGFEVFDRWSRKSEKYDKKQCEKKWDECGAVKGFNVGSIFHYATEAEPTWRELDAIPSGATVDDFVSYLPRHDYIYTPTGQHWPASAVNAFLPKQQSGNKFVKATQWLDRHRAVQGQTWSPGDAELIPDRIARTEGGWIEKPDALCLNLYHPAKDLNGDASRAGRWVDHVHRLYPHDAEHLINWFAQRVQQPGVKCNHGLIIGGEQGIGKDMILKPVRASVGNWNYVNIAPSQIMSNFNTYVRSVICQVDEARDLGDTRHYDFYEHLKTLTTAPPDLLQCNEKHISPYAVMNCTGVIITTNHRTGGVYLPPGDRRFYVAWSPKTREEFSPSYFNDLESFYLNGGYGHVQAYLRKHSLKGFNAKAAPPQTEAWRDVVDANRPLEDVEFAEALHLLENPDAVTLAEILKVTPSNSFANWLDDRRNSKKIAPRLESCGYISVRNSEKNGESRWRFRTKTTLKEVSIYAKSSLTLPARVAAAKALVRKLQALSS